MNICEDFEQNFGNKITLISLQLNVFFFTTPGDQKKIVVPPTTLFVWLGPILLFYLH
jgi:hypothetical protein